MSSSTFEHVYKTNWPRGESGGLDHHPIYPCHPHKIIIKINKNKYFKKTNRGFNPQF